MHFCILSLERLSRMPGLPNAHLAIVEPRKITHYLLSDTHPVGGPKSIFLKSFGFDIQKPEVLANALLRHAAAFEAVVLQSSPFGVNYAVRGPLLVPDGRSPLVKTVWIIDTGRSVPRFVTAVPD
jgi:hypothetical protein